MTGDREEREERTQEREWRKRRRENKDERGDVRKRENRNQSCPGAVTQDALAWSTDADVSEAGHCLTFTLVSRFLGLRRNGHMEGPSKDPSVGFSSPCGYPEPAPSLLPMLRGHRAMRSEDTGDSKGLCFLGHMTLMSWTWKGCGSHARTGSTLHY